MCKKSIVKLLLNGVAAVIILAFCSCRTTGQFSGTANFTIMIIDENGLGIKDYSVTLRNQNSAQNGITNANGICVFNNVLAGDYRLEGNKHGYTKVNSQYFYFHDKADIFCFEAICSDKVFDRVEELYELELYEKALELLDSISSEKKSSLNAAVCLYKAYGYNCLENKKQAAQELKKMKAADKSFTELYETLIGTLE